MFFDRINKIYRIFCLWQNFVADKKEPVNPANPVKKNDRKCQHFLIQSSVCLFYKYRVVFGFGIFYKRNNISPLFNADFYVNL